MNATFSKKTLALALGALVLGTASVAQANEANWDKNHPRRAEVNGRLANQNQRIKNEVKEGEISKGQAAKLHKEDRQIRGEERVMASHDGGHITKADQRSLNQQENAVSKQIGK